MENMLGLQPIAQPDEPDFNNLSPSRTEMVRAWKAGEFGNLLGDAFFALQLASMVQNDKAVAGEKIESKCTATMSTWIIEEAVKIGTNAQPPTKEGEAVVLRVPTMDR